MPRPTVPLSTGQPLSGPAELSLGASSLANTMDPRAADDSKALELPKHQARGELRIRIFERGEIAAVHERAIGRATKIDSTQVDVDSGQPWGAGLAARFSIAPSGAPWAVGLGVEILRWSVPYTELRTCVENCEDVDSFQEIHSTSGEATVGFGITPSYRLGRWSLFGGVWMRNHPSIQRKGSEFTEYNEEDTHGGPMNMLVHAGVAAKFGAFTALVLVNQNIDSDPVQYGPGIGLALSATLDPSVIAPASSDPSKMDEAKARMRRARLRREAAIR